MKNKSSFLNGLAIVLCCGILSGCLTPAHSQTTNTNLPPSFWGGLSEAGQAFVNSFKSDTNALASTNWAAIPFASYDVSQKKIGGGIAVVYPVNDLLYVGARLENINGTWTTPSIQVQLKKTITVMGLNLTPYGVGGTAIVNGNVAAYTGAGAYVNLFSFNVASHPLYVGLTADYEAWGGLPAPCGTKRVNGGLLLSYAW